MSIKLALSGIIALASVTSVRAIEGNNPGNIQEGPFAHAHGSNGSPRTQDTGNCFVNGRAPQWALDVLRSRGHGAAEDANGDELTLTDPVWANATCFRAKKWVSWEFGSSVSVPSSRFKCINFADKNPVVLHGWVVQSATIEENDDDGPPHTFMALIIDDPACPSSAPKPTPFMEEIQIPSTWLGHHVAIRGILDDGEYLGIDIKSIADIK